MYFTDQNDLDHAKTDLTVKCNRDLVAAATTIESVTPATPCPATRYWFQELNTCNLNEKKNWERRKAHQS